MNFYHFFRFVSFLYPFNVTKNYFTRIFNRVTLHTFSLRYVWVTNSCFTNKKKTVFIVLFLNFCRFVSEFYLFRFVFQNLFFFAFLKFFRFVSFLGPKFFKISFRFVSFCFVSFRFVSFFRFFNFFFLFTLQMFLKCCHSQLLFFLN
jgi:hypothetical protein